MTSWAPWLVLVLGLAGAALAWWRAPQGRSPQAGQARRVANSAPFLRSAAVAERVARRRVLHAALAVLAVVALGAAGVLVGRPVETTLHSDKLASRDIVLCLDVSTSMLKVDMEVLDAFDSLLGSFEGERVALVAWNSTAQTLVPLTDDYTLLREQFQTVREALDIDPDTASPTEVNRYYDVFSGTLSRTLEASSLAGDGLASCGLVFDAQQAQDRSRSIVYATDNLVFDDGGQQIYQLPEAADLLTERKVRLFTLYGMDDAQAASPYQASQLGPEEARKQLKEVTETRGGLFYDVTDSQAVGGIVTELQADQAKILDADPVTVTTDVPQKAAVWLALALLALLGLAAWRRA